MQQPAQPAPQQGAMQQAAPQATPDMGVPAQQKRGGKVKKGC